MSNIFRQTLLCHCVRPGARSEFFFWGGWQAVSLGGGVAVMEKRDILVGWATKVCLKCTKKLE